MKGHVAYLFLSLFTLAATFNIKPAADHDIKADSCVGICEGYDPNASCQCNSQCQSFGDCCGDYEEVCLNGPSCEGSCGNGYDPSLVCQCNDQCQDYGNCCDDYQQVCDNGSVGGGSSTPSPPADGCTVQLDRGNSWPSWPPIIVDSQTADLFVYPDQYASGDADDRSISFSAGQVVHLSCGGSGFSGFQNENFLTASCSSGTKFDVFGSSAAGQFDFGELGCQSQPSEYSKESGNSCGPNNEGTEIMVGFDYTTADFIPLFVTLSVTCFDNVKKANIYTKYVIPKETAAKDSGNERPAWKTDGYYDFDADFYYKQAQQEITVAELVGSEELAAQYIQYNSIYLSRGHMAANSDFLYYVQQDSTYYFYNCAPQWWPFNGDNWFHLEDGTRAFIEANNFDAVVYTGTSGICQLLDINNNYVDIWLYIENGAHQLPVPKFNWKVVVDPQKNAGIAFVAVNNPHITEGEIEEYKICSNPIYDHPIMDFIYSPNDIESGVIYACEVGDAASVIPEIPDELANLSLLS